MPMRNVTFTDELYRFVAKKVKANRYDNASEVLGAGWWASERGQQQYEVKIAALRAAIDGGDASGVGKGNGLELIRKALPLPVSPCQPWLRFVFPVALRSTC